MATQPRSGSSKPSSNAPASTVPALPEGRLTRMRPQTRTLLMAFGIGSATTQEMTMAILPREAIPDPGEIVLITGPSGSGKTQTLRLLTEAAHHTWIARCSPADLPDRPAAELWCPGGDRDDPAAVEAQEAITRLSHVGLSDPWAWARTPSELSEGQRHRLALADAIWTDADAVLADDWCTPLDDLTGRAVAWRTGRVLRDLDIGAVFATPRHDLAADLRPDKHIICGWGPDPCVVVDGYHRQEPTAVDELIHARGTWHEWTQLRHLHYVAGDPSHVRAIHVLRHEDLDHPAAVAVITYPELHNAARNDVTDKRYCTGDRRLAARRLNQEVASLARIVVAPELRGLGLAQRLIDGICETEPIRWLECQAVMSRYHPFLRNAGFSYVPRPRTQAQDAWDAVAYAEGWTDQPPPTAEHLQTVVDTLPQHRRRSARRAIWYLYFQSREWRRTRREPGSRPPNTTDARWPEAFRTAWQQLFGSPAYWIRRTPAADWHSSGTRHDAGPAHEPT